MPVMEIVSIDPMGVLSGLFVSGLAIGSVVIVIVIHICVAMAIFRDANNLPDHRKPIFMGPLIWFLATLLGGLFVGTIYWILHHSRLNPSVPLTPPEN